MRISESTTKANCLIGADSFRKETLQTDPKIRGVLEVLPQNVGFHTPHSHPQSPATKSGRLMFIKFNNGALIRYYTTLASHQVICQIYHPLDVTGRVI